MWKSRFSTLLRLACFRSIEETLTSEPMLCVINDILVDENVVTRVLQEPNPVFPIEISVFTNSVFIVTS